MTVCSDILVTEFKYVYVCVYICERCSAHWNFNFNFTVESLSLTFMAPPHGSQVQHLV